MEQSKEAAFYSKTWVIVVGSIISCGLWGSAATCIKIGYELFGVDIANIFSIIQFAGMRFTLAGLMVIVVGSICRKKLMLPKREEMPGILAVSSMQTVMQYIFYYIGTAYASGVSVALVNGAAAFVTVLVSCWIFRLERMTYRKFIGSVIGFLGVAIVILDGAGGGLRSGSYLGECMVMGSNLTCAIAACLSNKYTKTIDPILLCGYQFIIGGIVMILIGVAGGGHIGTVVPTGCILLFYMGIISSVAFSIRMTLLKYNEVSRVIVYSFFTPLTGVIMSGIFLKEDAFKLSMFASLALVSWGIYIVNKKVG